MNQGAIGSGMTGHLTVQAALRQGLSGLAGVAARFVQLPAWGVPSRVLARPWPGLLRWDLDLHAPRWHLAEGLRGRRLLAQEVAAFHPDVVLVDSHTAALLSVDLMRRVPTVLSVDVPVWDWHLMGIWRPVRWYSRTLLWPSRVLERRAFDACASVVARSDWAAAAVRRSAPGARVVTLPPGLDVERLHPVARTLRERSRVLFVGARFVEKGGEDLLAALAPRLGRDVELDVVTRDQVRELPGVRVHQLSGGSPGLVELFQQADIFVLPTRGDSFGWVILEAMACGTPVVATPLGAIPELLAGEQAGLLVPVGDRAALRDRLDELLADPERRARMGEAGRRIVLADHDVHEQGRRLAELFRELVRTG
ncbi:MAG: glycosyltransferase family 4 protein [Mycobacteriales bacterium]